MLMTSVFTAVSMVFLMFFQRNFHPRVTRAKALGKLSMYIIVNFMVSL